MVKGKEEGNNACRQSHCTHTRSMHGQHAPETIKKRKKKIKNNSKQ